MCVCVRVCGRKGRNDLEFFCHAGGNDERGPVKLFLDKRMTAACRRRNSNPHNSVKVDHPPKAGFRMVIFT